MNQINRITIHAPLPKIFLAASDLTRWPEFLPHYRHNRFLSQTPSGGVVKMSSIHAGIPLTGIQEFQIDPERRELRFTHLRSTLNATRGLEAVWTFEEQASGGVEVTITHHMAMSWPFFGRFLANKLVGTSLIRRIANKTLAGLKRKVEAQQQHAETSAAREKEMRSPKSGPAAKPKARRQPAPTTRKKTSGEKAPTSKPSKKPAPGFVTTAKAAAKPGPSKVSPAAKTTPKPAPTKANFTPKAAAKPAPTRRLTPTAKAAAKSVRAKVAPTPKAAAKPTPAKASPLTKSAAKPSPTKAGPKVKPAAKPVPAKSSPAPKAAAKSAAAKVKPAAKPATKPKSARKKK